MANTVLLESRSYRPFKSSEEYLYAMREDLAEWLNTLYPELRINTDNFMDRLDTGVALCKHSHNVRHAAEEYLARRQARNRSMTKSFTSGAAGPILAMGNIHFLPAAKSGTFFARDNVSNFISWCRKSLQIFECLLFETDDLIMRKNEKHVILCLLEVARRGAKFGMLAPMLVQMERQIDREIAADNKANGVSCETQTEGDNKTTATTGTDADQGAFESDSEDEDELVEPVLMYGPQPQIITNDLKSLDEMVRDLVEKCTCPSQFPMVRVSEGKYRIGDTKVLIFVRILRSHVMVRVGGGWDTLSHYLDKHDPCRCKAQHRSSMSARLVTRQQPNAATTTTTPSYGSGNGGPIDLHKAQVFYDRSPTPARKTINGVHGGGSPHHQQPTISSAMLSPPSGSAAANRSRSPTPHRRVGFNHAVTSSADVPSSTLDTTGLLASPKTDRRSVSPSVRRAPADLRQHKQLSLDSTTSSTSATSTTSTASTNNNSGASSTTIGAQYDAMQSNGDSKQELNCVDGKFENISDNGSEISDEGYRSLGLIQANNQNNNSHRLSMLSQTSQEDAELNVRLEITSTDSQTSNADDPICSPATTTSPPTDTSPIRSSPDQAPNKTDYLSPKDTFEQSGIFVTDDEISIETNNTNSTGLRKTGFSQTLYDDVPVRPLVESRIPRSPAQQRRKSIDNTSCAQTSGLPLSRKLPVYQSVRKTAASKSPVPKIKETAKVGAGATWNGRSGAKKRPGLGPDTFANQKSSTPEPSPVPFVRNTGVRASHSAIYDKNGRRVAKSTNTSPVKSPSPSPLAQQILEAAGSARNDSQMLDRMKKLLSKYTSSEKKQQQAAPIEPLKDYDNDFTTAWVNSNGTLDRVTASRSMSPVKMQSKRSSAASSIDSTLSREIPVLVARPNRGLSRIPGPVRQNTLMY